MQSILFFLLTKIIIVSGGFIFFSKLLTFSLNIKVLLISLPLGRPGLTKWGLSSLAGFPGSLLSYSFLVHPWLNIKLDFILNVHLLSTWPTF